MTKSMTAFAREVASIDVGELTWELRSVNHRFLEPNVRLPEELRGLDPKVRERLSARLNRGKVDCTLRFAPLPGAGGEFSINRRLMEQVLKAADEIAIRLGEPATPHVFELLQWPGLLQEPERDLDALASAAIPSWYFIMRFRNSLADEAMLSNVVATPSGTRGFSSVRSNSVLRPSATESALPCNRLTSAGKATSASRSILSSALAADMRMTGSSS